MAEKDRFDLGPLGLMLGVMVLVALVALAIVISRGDSPRTGAPAPARAEQPPEPEIEAPARAPAQPSQAELDSQHRLHLLDAARRAPGSQVLTPDELPEAYASNEMAADTRYAGKWYLIGGRVETVRKDITGSAYVTFIGRRMIGGVQCFFAPEAMHDATQLARGQKVVLLGKVKGLFMNVLVEQCLVVR